MKIRKLALTAILFAAALGASSAFARGIGPSSSWAQIYEYGYEAQFPKIQFGTIWASVDGLCYSSPESGEKGDQSETPAPTAEEQTIRTIHPVTYCAEFSNDETNECIREESRILSTPRKYSYELDIGQDGAPEIIKVVAEHALSYDIPVGHPATEGALEVMFYKTFDMPRCM